MQYIVFGLLSGLFAGLMAIFGKIGLNRVDTLTATFVRSLIMAGFFTIVILFKRNFNNFDKNAVFWIVASSLAGALSWLFYFWALKLGNATQVAALDRTSIVFVLILSAFFLAESITIEKIIGVTLILIGTILVIIDKQQFLQIIKKFL